MEIFFDLQISMNVPYLELVSATPMPGAITQTARTSARVTEATVGMALLAQVTLLELQGTGLPG